VSIPNSTFHHRLLDLGTDLDRSKEHKSDTAVYALDWSGENSLVARARAADMLATHVRELARLGTDVPHFIIAHSHGGNVALNALRHSATASLVRGVACLSTPFLYVRTRRIGSRAEKALSAMVFIYLLGIGSFGALVAAVKIEPLWGENKALAVGVALFVLTLITIHFFLDQTGGRCSAETTQ
jgi:hypothetical protein